jgi:hypothetical protein
MLPIFIVPNAGKIPLDVQIRAKKKKEEKNI